MWGRIARLRHEQAIPFMGPRLDVAGAPPFAQVELCALAPCTGLAAREEGIEGQEDAAWAPAAS